MGEKFYITTPIYYVNDKPHIGHAYTTILADVLARYHRLFGEDVFFLTGTDEHGQKVQRAARERGLEPQRHCDEMVAIWKATWRKLGISNDDFIRTTEERHIKVVREVLARLYEKGEIYLGEYKGWYCVSDERFWTDKDLVDGKCPECHRDVISLSEKNYFFKMGRYQDWLISYINDHPEFIQPETRRNEILGFLKQPLGDLCISRPKSRLSWGIPLPFDEDYVTYVWFDALINYISAVGYLSDDGSFNRWWPADCHLIGKDIVTTHSVYWPTMLRAAGIEMPRTIFAHGWWLVEEAKMSKSRGNVVAPLDLVDKYGVDAFRYFLMRDMILGQDSSFSEVSLVERFNSDLANDLGNLLSRTVNMIKRYCGGRIPRRGSSVGVDRDLEELASGTPARVRDDIRSLKPNRAIEDVMELVRRTNKYLEETAPWNLAGSGEDERLGTVLYNAAESLRISSILLEPVIPFKAPEIRSQLGLGRELGRLGYDELVRWGALGEGTEVKGGPPLFPRAELPVTLEKPPEPGVKLVDISEFRKLDLRVAYVEGAESVPGSDRLLRLDISLGDERRQIVAGIAEFYRPEDLVGRYIVVVANLKPAKIRGLRSEGMLLAAEDEDGLSLVILDRRVRPGAKVR